MGLFDFLKKKDVNTRISKKVAAKKELTAKDVIEFAKENADMLALQKAFREYAADLAGKDGVDTDEIPKGYGPYGLVVTNPIPTLSIEGSKLYLNQLRTDKGNAITYERKGSTSCAEVTPGSIDIYELFEGYESIATIYICPYHKRNSAKAPENFYLAI